MKLIPLTLRLVLFVCLGLLSGQLLARDVILVTPDERGDRTTGQSQLLHDPLGTLTIEQATEALANGEFTPLTTAGSTGLHAGAWWAHTQLHNPGPQPVTVHLEYIDHQLIRLAAFGRDTGQAQFQPMIDLSMDRPFAHRPVPHNRFVVPVTLPANETRALLVRFGSSESGYIFPAMRIWSPENLASQHVRETGLMGFLFGGFFLMGVFALIAALVTRSRLFFLYSLYVFSKITCWATILGYTHQFVLREQMHWSLMSISGALTIVLGLVFARQFLQTRRYTPRLDYLVLAMIANAGLLMLAASLQLKTLALITITLALLMYPLMIPIGLVRWRQGQIGAGMFSLAWSFLVLGLMMQALRDLGLVPHSLLTYYWPPVASFTEMLTIMFAMALQMRRLFADKNLAEQRYREHLEFAKSRLAEEVQIRTRELEQAKRVAELEARTDPLTGILNRRSFLNDASLRLKLARRRKKTCCLFMFDLDHFKRINDTCGHSVGDRVLCQFTNTIRRSIRETDVFGRLGGEEFALLVDEPKPAVYALAERLRSDTAKISVDVGAEQLVLTTSIGLAFAEDDASVEELLLQADKAMYQAKLEGRDRVIEAPVD